MDIAQIRLKKLRALVQEHGRKDVMEKLGITSSQLSQIAGRNPTRTIGGRLARRVEQGYGEDRGWMDALETRALTGRESDLGAGFITIERYAAAASAGPGSELSDEDQVIGNMRIARSWLTGRIGRYTAERNLRVISAMGDSMAPTFNDGDVLLVDTGVRNVDRDGIFVLRAHNRLFVKRVRQKLATGTYEVSSDNPTAGVPEELKGTEQIDVLGKVVGAWNWRIM